MILNSPYDTTVLRSQNMEAIKNAISLSLTDGYLNVGENNIVRIEKDIGSVMDIGAFEEPIVFNYSNYGTIVAVDLRFYLSYIKSEDAIRIKNPNEYNCALLTAKLTKRWTEGNVRSLLSLNTSILGSYANWVSGIITKKFALDIHETKFLKIYAAWFYISHFFDKELIDRDKLSIMDLVTRSINVQSSDVINQLTDATLINNLNDFVKVIKERSLSKRLERMTTGVLVSTLIGSWYGINAKTIIAVALEYPPTWLAIVHTNLTYSFYKKTLLGSTIINTIGYQKDNVTRAITNSYV